MKAKRVSFIYVMPDDHGNRPGIDEEIAAAIEMLTANDGLVTDYHEYTLVNLAYVRRLLAEDGVELDE